MKINKKKLKYGTAATVITVVVTVLVIIANVIIGLLSDRFTMSFDLTPNSDFAISDETKNYLASLNENVEICTTMDETTFQMSDNKYLKQAYEVLKKYSVGSDRISLKFVDMTVNPTYVERYKNYYNGSISENSIIVFNTNTHRIRVLSVYDLFNTEINFYTMSQSIVSSKAERTLTSAIMYITDPDPKTAVIFDVTTQSAVSGNIQVMLEDDGFDVVKIDPLNEEIPEDADLIVINSPLNDFSEELVDKLYDFMENGGNYGRNMIYLASAEQNATPNIDAFLAEWGLKAVNGIVNESSEKNVLTGSGGYAFVSYIGDSGVYSDGSGSSESYTSGIPAETLSNPIALDMVRPLEILFSNNSNITVFPLLETSDTCVTITPELMQEIMENGTASSYEQKSLPVIALSRKHTFINNERVLSNLLVFGSDSILNYGYTSQTYSNNGDYFLSIVNKISGKENGVDIVDKDLASASFQSTGSQIYAARIIFIFVLPGLVAAAGAFVWFRRRHK